MIRNIVFDYGEVVINWDPHHLYDPYFGSREKASWFLENICTYEWNAQHDNGKPVAEGTAELIAEHPEWEKEIRMYYGEFIKMIGGEIPGTLEYVRELKSRGYHVFGLTNWSSETFSYVRHDYPVFDEMEGMVVSGIEGVMKPAREIYELLLSRYSLKAEECVFIDDNPKNTAGAEAAGFARGIVFKGIDNLRLTLEPLLQQQ